MVAEKFPVLKLTQEAYDQLRLAAEENPAAYLDQSTDFDAVLESRGIGDYLEETGILSESPISLTPVAAGPPNRADTQALDFYHSLPDLTADVAVYEGCERMWAWMTHFKLHSYTVQRWPLRGNANHVNHIKRHWFVENNRDGLWDSNAASRNWWIAHTALKACQGAGGSFTAQQALDHFAFHPEHYHTLMGTGAGFTWHPVVLSEIVRALLNEAEGISREGVRRLWRRINLTAGTLLLDTLNRDELRDHILDHVESIMSDPALVSDRTKLRNQRPFTVLSLGAGVQSTVLALMADRGEYGFSRPDLAIFADTGWEPQQVYTHLEWLKSELSFEVVTVRAGNLKESILSGTNPEGRNFLDIPVYLKNPDGSSGVATRQCTRVYKMDPIRTYLRETLQIQPKRRAPKSTQVEMWLGISTEESARMKPSKDEWITNRYPLIENGFTRAQLLNWFNENYPGRYLPTSSCVGCPYHSDAIWKQLKERDPQSFQDAVFVDQALRSVPAARGAIQGEAFLHRARMPLLDIDFSEVTSYDDRMLEECEGLCGI